MGEKRSVKLPSWNATMTATMAASKLCDSCKSATASIFCRNDAAYLCIPCDSKIHAVNKVASRHARVWMCEVCEQAPAHVTCKADAAALCVSCDRDIHSANPLAGRHERFPVVPFYDSVVSGGVNNQSYLTEAEAASWLIPNLNSKLDDPDQNDRNQTQVSFDMYAEVDPYLDLEYGSKDGLKQDLNEQHSSGADGVVPEQCRNSDVRTLFGGNGVGDGCFDADFNEPVKGFPYFAARHRHSISHSVSSTSPEVGVVPDGGTVIDVSNPFGRQSISNVGEAAAVPVAVPLFGAEREARVLRYREKRKSRRFEKTIRYASRKAYAETRPRIKGRFAKRTESDVAVVELEGSYGVVPTY